tara:strand:+ start:3936 stop:5579 length:1644 start_codon:yes stop_codon:yes gene_type:complete
MSLNKFAKLFVELDSNNSINKKINLLIKYFYLNSHLNNIWTIYLLIGKNNRRFINGKSLRIYYADIYQMPIWLIDICYSKVGDSAEVISLLLKDKYKEKNNYEDISLNELIENILPNLSRLDLDRRKCKLKFLWESIPIESQLVFNKILTGSFRIGVSKGLVTKALAKMICIDESTITHRLMGDFDPSIATYEFLINKTLDQKELAFKPYPFQLANTFEDKIKEKHSVKEYQFESKWDGIRSQLIKRLGSISIWTRGEELINSSFPELVEIISMIEIDFVLDGEILIWDNEKNLPNDFSLLQKRIGRKSPNAKIQKHLPVVFVAYDILEINGKDLRDEILSERRNFLEKNFNNSNIKNFKNFSKRIKVTELHNINNWSEVEEVKNHARDLNTEGLVIKNKNSKYLPGRKKGNWWKYKIDPMQLDGILIYARTGSGIRADLYTDYSFALWKDNNLVKFANAYSGLSNKEIKELDKWIRKNTLERYGPVRSVKPELIFEISFDNIQISKRHKSGIALRFPRITKWRKDKKISDADNLDNALKLIKIKND